MKNMNSFSYDDPFRSKVNSIQDELNVRFLNKTRTALYRAVDSDLNEPADIKSFDSICEHLTVIAMTKVFGKQIELHPNGAQDFPDASCGGFLSETKSSKNGNNNFDVMKPTSLVKQIKNGDLKYFRANYFVYHGRFIAEENSYLITHAKIYKIWELLGSKTGNSIQLNKNGNERLASAFRPSLIPDGNPTSTLIRALLTQTKINFLENDRKSKETIVDFLNLLRLGLKELHKIGMLDFEVVDRMRKMEYCDSQDKNLYFIYPELEMILESFKNGRV